MLWPAAFIKYRFLSDNKCYLKLQMNFHNNLFSLANKCFLQLSGLASTLSCLKIFYKPIGKFYQHQMCFRKILQLYESFTKLRKTINIYYFKLQV